MADSLESTNINISNKGFYDYIKESAQKFSNEEVCGLVLKNFSGEIFVRPCANIHKDKKSGFMVSPEVFLEIVNKYKVLAVYHSHVDALPDPSVHDLCQSESLCLPFIIYSVKYDDFYIHIPESFPIEDFTGRDYIDGLQNCITLVVDYYRKNYGFKFDDFNFYLKRKSSTWAVTFRALLRGKNLARKNGFIRVKNSEIEADDVVMFQLGSNEVHLGV